MALGCAILMPNGGWAKAGQDFADRLLNSCFLNRVGAVSQNYCLSVRITDYLVG